MKKVFLLVFIIFLFILPHTLFSIETGNIAGKVYIRKTGKPLFQANVYVEDFKMGVLTRQDGSFIIKNIPAGIHTITVNFMGYGKQSKKVEIKTNLTTTVMFSLKMKPIGIAGITVTATRAIKRETPIAFTDITKSEINDKYTTQDLPLLLEAVPGLFANSTGIGEAQITMRGFEADKIQILINGIPVNDPESQKVYWSNWTGLSS
ncbi:MAG: TonB-dependent receptor, partial [Candidatus Cloacimonetes bacterium]|nr:TonB-dependent receptor [Candidatus Cloacimonadota bacterium]